MRSSPLIISKETTIDAVDREILLLITKGNPSPYSVWSTMNRQLQGRAMAYINVKKRIRHLVEMELLRGVKPDTAIATMRGRKDYVVTPKGLEYLLPDTHTIRIEDVKTITDYIRRVYNNKQLTWGIMLLGKLDEIHNLLSEYLKCVGRPDLIPMKRKQIDDLFTELHELSSIPTKPKPQQEIEDIVSKPSKSRPKKT